MSFLGQGLFESVICSCDFIENDEKCAKFYLRSMKRISKQKGFIHRSPRAKPPTPTSCGTLWELYTVWNPRYNLGDLNLWCQRVCHLMIRRECLKKVLLCNMIRFPTIQFVHMQTFATTSCQIQNDALQFFINSVD